MVDGSGAKYGIGGNEKSVTYRFYRTVETPTPSSATNLKDRAYVFNNFSGSSAHFHFFRKPGFALASLRKTPGLGPVRLEIHLICSRSGAERLPLLWIQGTLRRCRPAGQIFDFQGSDGERSSTDIPTKRVRRHCTGVGVQFRA
jgi:hypothetical protein